MGKSEQEIAEMQRLYESSATGLLQRTIVQDQLQDLFVKWQHSQPPRTGLHASSILSPGQSYCHREQVLGFSEPREQPIHNPALLAVFLNGWNVHEKWQSLFKLGGIAVEVEQSHVDKRWYLHFTPDAIIDLKGERYIVEIKGYKQEAYNKIDPEQPWVSSEYRKAHVQANLYMHMLGIQKGIVLFENKNTQVFKSFVIDYSPALADPYIERLNTLNDLVANYQQYGQLVERLPECSSTESPRAQKCPLRNACFRVTV